MKTKRPPKRSRPAVEEISSDQRLSARLACGPEIACRLLGPGALDCWAVRVQNLSVGGVSVLLDRVVPAGKMITAELHHRGRQFTCQRPVRVIYAVQIPGGGLMMGGAFCPPLTPQEIAQFE